MFSSRLILSLGVLFHAGVMAAEPAAPASNSAAKSEAAASAAEARTEMVALRKQIGELSRRMAELSLELGDVGPQAYAFRYMNDEDKAMIGVVLSGEPKGARIDGVTPDGPAARGGLRSGDVLVSVNGETLASSNSEDSLGKAKRALKDLKPGESVRLGYQRGGQATATIEVKAERREAWNWQALFKAEAEIEQEITLDQQIDIQRNLEIHANTSEVEAEREAARELARERAQEARFDAEFARNEAQHAREHARTLRYEFKHEAMPWWGINLASLNADLGRYFGADRGVLVLSASEEAMPEIKAGDVIRQVAGESVEKPEQALRALRDQDAGELVEIAILRDRKPVILKIKAPKYKSLFSIGHPPTPPTAPVPPAPPAPVKPVRAPTAAPPPAPPAPSAPPTPPDPPSTSAEISVF